MCAIFAKISSREISYFIFLFALLFGSLTKAQERRGSIENKTSNEIRIDAKDLLAFHKSSSVDRSRFLETNEAWLSRGVYVKLLFYAQGLDSSQNPDEWLEAKVWAEVALDLARRKMDSEIVAEATYFLGNYHLKHKNLPMADKCLNEALAQYRLLKKLKYQQDALLSLAAVYTELGRTTEVIPFLNEVIEIAGTNNTQQAAAANLNIASILYAFERNATSAVPYARKAVEYFSSSRDRTAVLQASQARSLLAEILQELGETKEAVETLVKEILFSVEEQLPLAELRSRKKLGECHLFSGDKLLAKRAFDDVVSAYSKHNWNSVVREHVDVARSTVSDRFPDRILLEGLLFLTLCNQSLGLLGEAERAAQKAAELGERLEMPSAVALSFQQLGFFALLRGDDEAASTYQRKCLAAVSKDEKATETFTSSLMFDRLVAERQGLSEPRNMATILSALAPGRNVSNSNSVADILSSFSPVEARRIAGEVRIRGGLSGVAILLLRDVLEREEKADNDLGQIKTLEMLSWAELDEGRDSSAIRLMLDAVKRLETWLSKGPANFKKLDEDTEDSPVVILTTTNVTAGPLKALYSAISSPRRALRDVLRNLPPNACDLFKSSITETSIVVPRNRSADAFDKGASLMAFAKQTASSSLTDITKALVVQQLLKKELLDCTEENDGRFLLVRTFEILAAAESECGNTVAARNYESQALEVLPLLESSPDERFIELSARVRYRHLLRLEGGPRRDERNRILLLLTKLTSPSVQSVRELLMLGLLGDSNPETGLRQIDLIETPSNSESRLLKYSMKVALLRAKGNVSEAFLFTREWFDEAKRFGGLEQVHSSATTLHTLALKLGDLQSAKNAAEQCLRVSHAAQRYDWIGDAHLYLARIYDTERLGTECLGHYEAAVRAYERTGGDSEIALANALSEYASVLIRVKLGVKVSRNLAGEHLEVLEQSIKLQKRALQLHEKHNILASVAIDLGQIAMAEASRNVSTAAEFARRDAALTRSLLQEMPTPRRGVLQHASIAFFNLAQILALQIADESDASKKEKLKADYFKILDEAAEVFESLWNDGDAGIDFRAQRHMLEAVS